MTLDQLGIGYVCIGTVIAIAACMTAHRPKLADGLLLAGLWPLYAPFWFAGRHHADAREAELFAALRRARASPLAALLPDAETARVLAGRLREAGRRLGELDAVLARPAFDPREAERRAAELTARGAVAAAATAQLRVRTLGQLAALRVRYRRELDEVGELIAQLVTQAELVRLEPALARESGELVRELVTRLDGLGDLFAYQAALEHGESV